MKLYMLEDVLSSPIVKGFVYRLGCRWLELRQRIRTVRDAIVILDANHEIVNLLPGAATFAELSMAVRRYGMDRCSIRFVWEWNISGIGPVTLAIDTLWVLEAFIQ